MKQRIDAHVQPTAGVRHWFGCVGFGCVGVVASLLAGCADNNSSASHPTANVVKKVSDRSPRTANGATDAASDGVAKTSDTKPSDASADAKKANAGESVAETKVETAGQAASTNTPASPTEPGKTEPAKTEDEEEAPPYVWRGDAPADPDARPRNISFDDLEFQIEQGGRFKPEMLTPKIKSLVGKRIRIRGFFQNTPFEEVRNFILIRDNQFCCYGPGAKIFHNVRIHMKDGKTARYEIRPVAVEGLFTLKEEVRDDSTWAIFYLEADSVE